MKENIAFMKDFQPLNEEEFALLDKVVEIINSVETIPCTSCKYCTEVCPKDIAIPRIFGVLNDTENNCKTYQAVANEKGLTRERIRQVRVNAMRGMYCKTLRQQTRRQLEDIAEVVFSAEQSELDTTFVKQK